MGNVGKLGIDRKIILKWILEKCSVRMWFGLNLLGTGASNGLWIP
jgi:hypothetical protein